MNSLWPNSSEQQLLDCDKGNGGCNGGWYTTAWDYIMRVNGCANKSFYAYVARVNYGFSFTEQSLTVK